MPAVAPTGSSASIIEVEVRTVDDTLARLARVSVQPDGDSAPHILFPTSIGTFHGELAPDARQATLTVTVPEHATLTTRVELPRERPARFTIRPRALILSDSVLDMAALTRKDQRAPAIETKTADSGLAQVNSLLLERRDAQLRRMMLPDYRASDADSTFMQAIGRATSIARATSDPRVRTAAYVSRFTLLDINAPRPVDMAREFMARLTPDDPILRDADGMEAVNRAIIFSDTAHGTDAADSARIVKRRLALQRAYILPIARDVTVPTTLRASAYINVIFGHAGFTDQDTLDTIIDEAVAALPKNPSVVRLASTYGRTRILRVGAPFPTFSMRALGDSLSPPITNESFRGKVTLIDFWGLWCAPCVAEMPVLHDAYAKFGSRGFTILSIDTDIDIARVAAFRKAKWPMPWLHGWARGGPESPALRALGVSGFPTAVLVAADGRILSVNTGLRGAALNATLTRLFP